MPLPLSPLPFSRHIMTLSFSSRQCLKNPKSLCQEGQFCKKPALTCTTCNGRARAVVTTYAHAAAAAPIAPLRYLKERELQLSLQTE